jgi:hypothetical protein
MPSFDEDVTMKQHDLVLHDSAGIDVVRIDHEAAVTIGSMPAPPKDPVADAPTGSETIVLMDPWARNLSHAGRERSEWWASMARTRSCSTASTLTTTHGRRTRDRSRCGASREGKRSASTDPLRASRSGATGGPAEASSSATRTTVCSRGSPGDSSISAPKATARAIYVHNDEGGVAIELDGHNGRLLLNGTAEQAARIDLRNAEFRDALSLDAGASSLTLGCEDAPGRVLLRDREQRVAITLEADGPSLTVDTDGASGDLVVVNSAGGQAFHAVGGTGKVQVGSPDDNFAGNIGVYDEDGREVVQLRGFDATQYIGAVDGGAAGRLVIRDEDGASPSSSTAARRTSSSWVPTLPRTSTPRLRSSRARWSSRPGPTR